MNIYRLDTMIAEGRLIRYRWLGVTSDGRETACLLAALYPECGDTMSVGPANDIDPWLAAFTPWIDDAGTEAHWPEVVRRYAAVIRRVHVLDSAAWRRAELRSLLAVLGEAQRHNAKLCDRAIALIARELSGDAPAAAEWTAAAGAKGSRAAKAAARRSSVAHVASMAVAAARSRSLPMKPRTAAAIAADRIIDGVLQALEDTCAECERGAL